jgi:hypothetical protein
MPRTLPEAKRAKRDKRRNAKRDRNNDRARARDTKNAFAREFATLGVLVEEPNEQNAEENNNEINKE